MKNNPSQTNKSKSRLKLWLWIFGAILLSIIVAVIIMLYRKPRSYQPIRPDNPEQVSLYLTHRLGPDFYNQVQLDEPFELVIEQNGLNDIVSRIRWPQQFGHISFSEPVIHFTGNSIILMGNLEINKVRSVLSVICSPQMAPDKTINMNIQSIQMGRMPVKAVVLKLAQSIFEQNLDAFSEDPEAAAIVQGIIQNQSFVPIFWIANYKVRITDFTLEPALLRLTLEPLTD